MSIQLPPRQQHIEFRVPTHLDLTTRQQRRMLLAVCAAFMPLLLFPYLFGMDTAKVWPKLLQRMSGDLDSQLTMALWLAACFSMLVRWRLSARHERLTLSAGGIAYRSPWQDGWKVLQKFEPDWAMRWQDIRSIELASPPALFGLALVRLQLSDAAGAKRVLDPQAWTAEKTLPESPKGPTRAQLRGNPELARKIARTQPLCAALELRGFELPAGTLRSSTYKLDHLEKHPGLRLVMMAIIAMVPFAVIGLFLNPYVYVQTPWTWFGVVATIAFVTGETLGRGAIPAGRYGFAAVLAAATGIIAYPGLLRLNAWTAEAPALHRYHEVCAGLYQPLEQGLPELSFADDFDYWSSFPPGSEHGFEVLRGRLGFWQYNSLKVDAEINDWRRRQQDPAKQRPHK